jgi:homoserine dehydrogenase
MDERVRVGILGCGHVGGALVRLIHDHADVIEARAGVPLEVARVAVHDLTKDRDLPLPARCFTDDADAVVGDPDVDIVVEVIGGIEPARSLLLAAFAAGKPVVTANKALLASDGATIHDAAAKAGVDLYFEASVAGGIPLLRPLKESLAGERISRVLGLGPATSTRIRTRLPDTAAGRAEALDEATALGYAEADPSADIEGFDAAAKAAILASIAFHSRVTVEDVHREGIVDVTAADIASAKAMHRVVKLLAICERAPGGVSVRVHPAMIPATHPLASVGDAFNAVFVEAAAAGQLMFYGRGAGGAPTASAVLGDVVAVARNLRSGSRGAGESAYASLRALPMDDVPTRYHVNLDVADKAGVLAVVATAFADNDVSIGTVRQEGHGDDATLVLVTHTASDAALRRTVETLRSLDVVRAVTSVMRVED